MYCLVAAATSFEIAPVLERFRDQPPTGNGIEIGFIITGVGLTATTYSLVKQIEFRRPALVIQAGIAGCFDKAVPLASVVAIERDAIGDQVVEEDGSLKTLVDLGLLPANESPFQNGWLVNDGTFIKKSKLARVTGITTNEITTSGHKANLYLEKYNPKLESLEGAALHYVAGMENIEYLQLRSISNYIGERDKNKWQLKESITALNKELVQMLDSL